MEKINTDCKLEKFRLNFSKCANHNQALLRFTPRTPPTHPLASTPSSKCSLPTLVSLNFPHLFHNFRDCNKLLFVILCVSFLLLTSMAPRPFRRCRFSLQSWTLYKNEKMYFLTLWNARLFVVLFRMFGIRSYYCFSLWWSAWLFVFRYIRQSFAVQGHSTASLVIFLPIFFYFCR